MNETPLLVAVTYALVFVLGVFVGDLRVRHEQAMRLRKYVNEAVERLLKEQEGRG